MVAGKRKAFAVICQTLVREGQRFLTALQSEWTGERLYGFRFEVHDQSSWKTEAAATEEGLTRVAATNARKRYGSQSKAVIDLCRVAVRWAGPDDGWYTGQSQKLFAESARLFTEAEELG